MYKLRVYIYLSLERVPKLRHRKSYGFKSLVKLGSEQTSFKIPLGTRVFKKSCSTSLPGGIGALFHKIYGFFCSKSRAWQLLSLASRTKPSGLKQSHAKWNLSSQASYVIASKANQVSKAKQASIAH